MKSSNVLLLFLWCSLLLFALFFNKAEGTLVDTATYEQTIQSVTTAIELENKRFEIINNQAYDHYHTINKQSVWPVLNALDSLSRKKLLYNELLDSIHKQIDHKTLLSYRQKVAIFRQLENTVSQQDSFLLKIYKELLKNKYFRLRDKHMEREIANTYKRYETMSLEYAQDYSRIPDNDVNFKLKIVNAQLSNLQRLYFFERLFWNYVRTPCFSFERYYVVVNPKKLRIKSGDYFESEIGIGTYYTSFDTSLVKIVVNGDTLKMNSDSYTASFKAKATNSGPVDLKIECHAVNPLTGEKSRTSQIFTYDVD